MKLRSRKWRAPSSSCISFPLERPLTPLAAVSIIWRWKSATDAVQQRLAALGYPLDEGPIEEDNVRFLLIRGPDGERLEFDACER